MFSSNAPLSPNSCAANCDIIAVKPISTNAFRAPILTNEYHTPKLSCFKYFGKNNKITGYKIILTKYEIKVTMISLRLLLCSNL